MSYAMQGLGQADSAADLIAWRRDYGLARDAGIPVPVLKAIKGTESHGNPAAIRFEPHIFWRTRKHLGDVSGPAIRAAMTAADMAAVPYTPGNTSWRSANGLAPCRIDRSASCTGSETNHAAFTRAFAIDPDTAVRSTSWGSGQVLGGHLLDAFGGNPQRAVAGFFANPTEAGERMIVAWWRAPGRLAQEARAAANATPPDLQVVAHRYNGCPLPCEEYTASLQRGYAEAAPAWERVRAAVEAAGAITLSAVRSTATTMAVVSGIGLLVGGAAFAWWTYSQRKPKRNARRRSSRHRRSSRRTSRNPSNGPVTLYAVDSDGRRRELGVARGRSQFVKLVKASVPVGTGSYLEVEGYGHALKDVGSSYGGRPMTISTPHGSVVVRGTPLARLP